jgi:hypothetical protein
MLSTIIVVPTPAEKTAAIVSIAVQTGASLCIPGAREMRVGGPAARRTAAATGGAPPADADTGTASQRERREYEIAGGGAPGERSITRRATVIERLCRLLRVSPTRQPDAPPAGSTSSTTPLSSLAAKPR